MRKHVLILYAGLFMAVFLFGAIFLFKSPADNNSDNTLKNNNYLPCNESMVTLEGVLGIIESKYPIDAITTRDQTYWMYSPPENFDENVNKRVRIQAILSPYDTEKPECNVCIRECNNCQCPLQDLLYDVKILEVLE